MEHVWRIEMLGGLRAIGSGQSVARFRTRKVASLLAYLAYFPQRIHSRDEIVELLWPDSEGTTARQSLRQALSSLRQVLELPPVPRGAILLSIHDGVQLEGGSFTTDVDEFETLIGKGKSLESLKRAANLYKGDLLPGFSDEWVWPERLRLEDLYLSVLRRIGQEEEPEAAIDYLRRGVIHEPFNEWWHVELMKQYLQLERPHQALSQYRELETALEDSFGYSPSPQARALAGQANRSKSTPTSARESNPNEQSARRQVSLPIFPNRYFARDEEIAWICTTLEEGRARLVTILGPAGVGKTRLSVQCARAISERQDWNVWFVPLANHRNAEELYEGVLAAIDPKHGTSSAELSRIAELIGRRQTLLVLDNLEQIAEEAGAFVGPMLERIPNLMCLTSSRQPMQILGEHIIAIDPLPIPSESTDDLSANPSVQLFLDRAQAMRRDLNLTPDNSDAIVDLCARLEGLPLALEIAAGLSSTFSPAQMLQHLPYKLTGLTSPRRDIPDRHKSLRAAIDWSYDLLTPELQLLFKNLCVFRGGFTLASAMAICMPGLAAPGRERALGALQSLQERSLLRGQPSEDGLAPRFGILVAFREYAEEQLAPDELQALRERHADFFAAHAMPDRPFQNAHEETVRHLEVEAEYDNYIAAIEHSLHAANLDRSVRLLEILSVRWPARSPRSTERRLTKEIASRPETSSLPAALRIKAQRMLGTIFIRSGEYESAYEAVTKAVEIAIAEGDKHLIATCYSGLSICAGYLGRLDESLVLNRKVLELAETDDLVLAERSYLGMGSVYGSQGRLADAGVAFDKARAISEKLRGGEPDALIVSNQAQVALDSGRNAEALRLAHESIRISRRLQGEFTLAIGLSIVSRYHSVNGNLEAAVATNIEALKKFEKGDFLFFILQTLRNHAVLLAKQGRLLEAVSIFAATDEISATDSQYEVDGGVPAALTRLRGSLSPLEFESAWARGLAMDRREAVRLVMG